MSDHNLGTAVYEDRVDHHCRPGQQAKGHRHCKPVSQKRDHLQPVQGDESRCRRYYFATDRVEARLSQGQLGGIVGRIISQCRVIGLELQCVKAPDLKFGSTAGVM